MKFCLMVSMLMHVSLGWFLYVKLLMPPRIALDTPMVLNLVTVAEPPPPKPAPPPPEEAPAPKPEPPKKETVVKKPPSPLEKLLSKVRQQRKRRDRPEPTPTPFRVASVPTVAPVKAPSAKRVPTPKPGPQKPSGPVDVELPAGAYRYDYYLSVIRNTLRRNWTVPQVPDLNRCMTVVEMTLSRDGRVIDYRTRSSSGNRFFDQSVEDAVRGSVFPQFADDYQDNQMKVTVRFRPVQP